MTTAGPKPVLACASQSYGFGPVARLAAIASEARAWASPVFVGTPGTALDFATDNPGLFDSVIAVSDIDEVGATCADAPLLSVMDPLATLSAARRGRKAFHVDGLVWFWDWTLEPTESRDRAHEFLRAPELDIRAVAAGFHPHELMRMAHHWATHTYVSDTVSHERLRDNLVATPVEHVGAIVHGSGAGRVARGSERPVVSVSGSLSPDHTHDDVDRYLMVISAILKLSGVQNPLVVGHPYAAGVMAKFGWDARFLPRGDMSAAIAGAPYVLTPPGLNTVLDAAALGVPVGFLPGWNDAHQPVVEFLNVMHGGTYPAVHTGLGVRMRGDPHPNRPIFRAYESALRGEGPVTLDDLAAQLREVVLALRSQDPDHTARRQRAALDSIYGDLHGARRASDHIATTLGLSPPARSRPRLRAAS